MKIKIVFDLGGVAIEWSPGNFVRDLCQPKSRQETFDRIQAAMMNAVFQDFSPSSDWAQFDGNRMSQAQLASNIFSRIRSSAPEWDGTALDIRAWIDELPARLRPIQATLSWLGELQAKHVPLYFLSNMPKPFVSPIKRHHQLFSHFDDGIFSGEVGLVKPEAEIFRLATDRFKFTSIDKVIFIDDNKANVDAARQFGWDAIHHVDIQETINIVKRSI
jgi:HAD superfamily hydrolase (TIGR01509 family)